jgi:hypothetical protein
LELTHQKIERRISSIRNTNRRAEDDTDLNLQQCFPDTLPCGTDHSNAFPSHKNSTNHPEYSENGFTKTQTDGVSVKNV